MNKITIRIVNTLVFLALAALSVMVIRCIIILWPSSNGDCCVPFCGMELNEEKRYFLLVALGGVLGSFVHIATSFVDYLGNKQIVISWVPWYLMRPFIGASLAIIFYMLLRGGIVSTQAVASSSTKQTTQVNNQGPSRPAIETAKPDSLKDSLAAKKVIVDTAAKPASKAPANTGNENADKDKPSREDPLPFNPFGIIAIACLTGMFSKQAADKLREVFETLFNIKRPTERADKLTDINKADDTSKDLSQNNEPKKEG